MALADLHHALPPGAAFHVEVPAAGAAGAGPSSRGGGGVEGWSEPDLADVLVGAGLDIDTLDADGELVRASGRRARSLPDTVGPGMRLLVCGLNPSLYAADRGVAFARPGNRFWPAAIETGLVSRPLDARHALACHGIGFTDLCKRATAASAELSAAEYRDGAARVERLAGWMQPGAVLFVGLEGWRAAFDRRATPGRQPRPFGGRPVYVMPSTSGLNARTSRAELVGHLRAAARLART